MKKVFEIENLECAHCAAKMEEAIRKIEGVKDASINFIKARLTIDAEDGSFDSVMKKAQKECAKIEPDAQIIL